MAAGDCFSCGRDGSGRPSLRHGFRHGRRIGRERVFGRLVEPQQEHCQQGSGRSDACQGRSCPCKVAHGNPRATGETGSMISNHGRQVRVKRFDGRAGPALASERAAANARSVGAARATGEAAARSSIMTGSRCESGWFVPAIHRPDTQDVGVINSFTNESLTPPCESPFMDHVLAFRAWPAAPDAGLISPISSVLGGCSRCPTASPAMGFLCPAEGRKLSRKCWQKRCC